MPKGIQPQFRQHSARSGRTKNPELDELREYFEMVGETPLLTNEQEYALGRRIKDDGDESALQELAEANLRWVVKLAQKYRNCGLSFMDLIAEGNVGLMIAAQRFDPDRGTRFTTHATWWISRFIKKALAEQSRHIRLPTNVYSIYLKVEKAVLEYRREHGHEPTPEIIAKTLGGKLTDVRGAMVAMKTGKVVSGQLCVSENGEELVSVFDLHVQKPELDVFERRFSAEGMEQYQIIDQLIEECVPLQQALALRIYFGIIKIPSKNPEGPTLEEIGMHIKISREKARQLVKLGLEKLTPHMEKRRGDLLPHRECA